MAKLRIGLVGMPLKVIIQIPQPSTYAHCEIDGIHRVGFLGGLNPNRPIYEKVEVGGWVYQVTQSSFSMSQANFGTLPGFVVK